MATKWNGFRYSKIGKALCAVMALLTAAGCVFLLAYTVDSMDSNYFSVSDLLAKHYTDTHAFYRDASNVVNNAVSMVQTYISQEAMEDGSAFEQHSNWYKPNLEKEAAKEIKRLNDALANNEPYYDEFIDNSDYKVVDGKYAVDEDYVRARMAKQAQNDLNNAQREFNNGYAQVQQDLHDTRSIQYAVIDRASGRVCTNMEGLDPQTAVEALPWFFLSNSNGKKTSDQTNNQRIFNSMAIYFDYDSVSVDIYVGFDEGAAAAAARPLDGIAQNAKDFYAYANRNRLMAAAALLLFILFVLCCVNLILVAGRSEKGGTLHMGKTDRIWNFFHWAAGLGGGFLLLVLELNALHNQHFFNTPYLSNGVFALLCALAVIPVGLLWLDSLLSFARHVKNRSVFKNTAPYKLWSKLRGTARLRSIKRSTALVLLGFAAYFGLVTLLTFIFGSWGDGGWFLLLSVPMVILGAVAAWFLLARYTTALDDIRHALEETRRGNLRPTMDTSKMPIGIQAVAEGIHTVQQGMQAAVQKAIAGERMRTELITNVSHDLKTPLTSVINYVDLLRRDDITEEERSDYLLTLAQKSEQLKHLIDDLVEASKAITGNVELNPVEVNLHELALQAMGETSDTLSAEGIEVIVQVPEQAPIVWADSEKTWRIIENLMNNAAKYTLPGTRVYIQLQCEDGYGGLTIKNISREPLNIPAEELTQRFVRGDASRTGEGSGLGLSIAESLCKIQGGKFEISVDGDLFKAAVWLPIA